MLDGKTDMRDGTLHGRSDMLNMMLSGENDATWYVIWEKWYTIWNAVYEDDTLYEVVYERIDMQKDMKYDESFKTYIILILNVYK